MKNYLAAMAIALSVFVIEAEAEPPPVFWSAEPVLPGDTALMLGRNLGAGGGRVSLSQLDAETFATVAAEGSESSLRFEIPPDWAPGIFRWTMETPAGTIELLINQPQPWWFQANRGQSASEGSWLSIFGRCLELIPGRARVELRNGSGKVSLTPNKATMWNLDVELPKNLAVGNWEIHVYNGCGGEDGWQIAGSVEIIPPKPFWKERVFELADYGAIPNDDLDDSSSLGKALEAIGQNGGGILRLARGRFRFNQAFVLPPRLLIEGAGAAATHLVWADVETPPPAWLTSTEGKLGLRDLSLYAHNYETGLLVEAPKGAMATDILIERVNARFTPFSLKLTPEAQTARRDLRREVFQIRADRVSILDCDFAWHSHIGISAQGHDIVCRRNQFFSQDGGWCPVGGGTRSVVEHNQFIGITTGATRGSQVWFAHNRVEHQYSGFREGFTTDGTFGGPGFLENVTIDGRHARFEAKRGRSDPAQIPAILRILEGKGAGLVQRIESFDDDGKGFTLRQDWQVVPDETSVLWVANEMGQHLCYGNEISDTGIAIQLYGSAFDCVVAENISRRSGGFRAKGNWTCGGVMFLGNQILEGHGTIGPEANAGESMIDIEGPYVEGFKGVTARGFVIRRNRLENDSSIRIRGSVHDAVIEHNQIHNTGRAILADQWGRQQGILARKNICDNVEIKLEPPAPGTWKVE